MGDVDMLGRATEVVEAFFESNLSSWQVEDPERFARDVLEAAGVLGAGAQPPPVHQDGEPSMHDLLVTWMTRYSRPGARLARIRIMARRGFGLAKYGTTLQISGPRDPREDMADEVADGLAYAERGYQRAVRADDADLTRSTSWWWLDRRDTLARELIEIEEGPPSD